MVFATPKVSQYVLNGFVYFNIYRFLFIQFSSFIQFIKFFDFHVVQFPGSEMLWKGVKGSMGRKPWEPVVAMHLILPFNICKML